MEAHPAGARLPLRPLARPQARQFLPRLPAVARAEDGRVLDAGVDLIRIGERRLQMPDPLELPRMRRPVVPLMRARIAIVSELIADRLPRFAAVAGTLDHLPEPTARLRGVDPVRIDRRAFHVVDLPPAEVGARDVPLPPMAVGGEDERPLARADENPNAAHDENSVQSRCDEGKQKAPIVDRGLSHSF